MARLSIAVLLLLSCLLLACGEGDVSAPAGDGGPPAGAPAAGGADDLQAGRLLVRSAEIGIRAEDPAATRQQVEGLVRTQGGYVERASSRGPEAPAELVLRVPADVLDDVLAQIRGLAVEVLHEVSSVEDVTSQAVDLDARRSALATTEKELLELLGDSRELGSGADTILTIFERVTDVRTRIERLDAERALLAQQVAMARLRVTIRRDVQAKPYASSWAPIAFAAECGGILVRALEIVSYVLIFVIVVVLPILAVVVFLVAVTRKVHRRLWAKS